MTKKQKKMLTRILVCAVMLIALQFLPELCRRQEPQKYFRAHGYPSGLRKHRGGRKA